MRKFVMGDIHGGYKAMLQCLERSGFDYKNDLLIQLGDIVDGYPQVYECVEELLKINNLIAIRGNHDDWFNEFITTDYHPYYWTYGGKGTLISYLANAGIERGYILKGKGFKTSLQPTDIPQTHKEFFYKQRPYYIDDKQRCFVHAGFKRLLPFEQQTTDEFYWDRSLWADAISFSKDPNQGGLACVSEFSEIYIGHTPTTKLNSTKPITAFNITNLDTGASKNGMLTIMDITTKQFWQSDLLVDLYSEYPSLTEN